MKLPPLFNPSNDMALAANVRQYFPPCRIRQMEEDLRELALYWDEGPWGWSLATKQHYLRQGYPEQALPSDEWLAELRRLSSREFGVNYYSDYSDNKGYRNYSILPCESRFCQSAEETLTAIAKWPTAMLKSPWSSSGRGNFIVRTGEADSYSPRIRHTIAAQGGIVAEPFYADKTQDFAMEFWVSKTGAEYLGLSVFSTDETGHYGGNFVESQEELRQRLGLPDALLDDLAHNHCARLSELTYRGPVGIDMMKIGDWQVHPCVEINFRMTMGLLAILLYNKGIREDQSLTPSREHGFACGIRQGQLSITFRP